MGLEDLLSGPELILKHTNHVKDLPSKGHKDFTPNNSWLEKKQIENLLEERFQFIKATRIEKCNSLTRAEWVPEVKKAKVVKKCGKALETFGHHQDNEDWLFPEEALYLLENCELHLYWDNVLISVEDCYELVFNKEGYSLDEYRTFSYLLRAGFRVVRHSPSVSVTRYEKQVNLDSVFQQQKRSPPREQVQEITISDDDDDITIISPSKSSLEKPKSSAEKSCTNKKSDQVVVILSDDSDNDSDVVCLSSPAVASRPWYPPVQRFVGLSEANEIDYRSNIRNIFDLIKCKKFDILARVPSVEDSLPSLAAPDKRLLPRNIVPKFAEYKLNLNVKTDESRVNFPEYYDNQASYGVVAPPFGPFNESNNIPPLMQMPHNPLLAKAQEMQAMAMNMMQTAATLMSFINVANQNPNELWNICANPRDMVSFSQSPRPFQPGGLYRGPRPFRRFHMGRGYFHRKNYRHQRQYNTQQERMSITNEKEDIVVLSDDEEMEDGFNTKRKPHSQNSLPLKRLKAERDNNSFTTVSSSSSPVIFFTSSEEIKKERDPDIKIKAEPIPSIKTEVNDTIAAEPQNSLSTIAIKTEEDVVKVKNEPTEKVSNDAIPEKPQSSIEIAPEEYTSNGLMAETERNESLAGKEIPQMAEENCVNSENEVEAQIKSSTCENAPEADLSCWEQFKNIPKNDNNGLTAETERNESLAEKEIPQTPEKNCLDTENAAEAQIESSTCENAQGSESEEAVGKENHPESDLSCWERLKNIPKESVSNEDESIFNFEGCSSYVEVLSALDVFKPIEGNRAHKKFKVSFDVYLGRVNFQKSLKLLPNYRVIVVKASEEVPTTHDIECLKIDYQDNIPFLFSVVQSDSLVFYLYDAISMNIIDF